MYRISIVDTDEKTVKVIEDVIKNHPLSGLFDVKIVSSTEDLQRLFGDSYVPEEGAPDVAIVDANFGGKHLLGVGLVKMVQSRKPTMQIVYTTNSLESMNAVYSTDHVSTCLKPLNRLEFEGAFCKALTRCSAEANQPMGVRVNGNLVTVMPSQITYIESNRRKVVLHVDGKELETYASIGALLDILPGMFVQCHKSFLVNLAHVSELRKDDVLLHDGNSVPVSQKRRKEMQEALKSFLRQRVVGGVFSENRREPVNLPDLKQVP